MPKQGLSEIVCVIDRSGSMETIKNDAIGGFNTFLEEQKKLQGDANLTMILFDHEYLVFYNGKNIGEVQPLDEKSYRPRGTTALLDAIGRTLVTVGERLDSILEQERPEKVIVAILTDGEENSSEEYNRKQIIDMVSHQRDTYSWEFIYLAANQDAIKEGATFGIHAKDAFNFVASGAGVKCAYSNMSRSVASYRAN